MWCWRSGFSLCNGSVSHDGPFQVRHQKEPTHKMRYPRTVRDCDISQCWRAVAFGLKILSVDQARDESKALIMDLALFDSAPLLPNNWHLWACAAQLANEDSPKAVKRLNENAGANR